MWRVDGPPIVPPYTGGHATAFLSAPSSSPETPAARKSASPQAQVAWEKSPPSPPAQTTQKRPSPFLPAEITEERLSPSPQAGRAGEGLSLTPIEDIRPGDYVLSHDGQAHRVLHTFQRAYQGEMIGLRHPESSATLWLTANHKVLAKLAPRSLGGHADWSGIPKSLRGRSQELRRTMTPPERRLWQFLRGQKLGVAFRRQHPVGRYIADFYSREACLVVEVDGHAAHDGEQAQAHDAARDAWMESLGLRVVRIPAKEVLHNTEGVLIMLREVCKEQLSAHNALWIPAGELRTGDLVFYGPSLKRVRLSAVEHIFTSEEVFDLEVEDAHVFLTEVCVVGSMLTGTEKLDCH